MKVWRGLSNIEHADGRRENVVQSQCPVFGRDRRGGLEGRYLGQRMHTGIGAAGALGQYIFAGQPSNSRGECALDGGAAGLHLPAGEVGAVVGEDQFEIAHGWLRIRHGLSFVIHLCWFQQYRFAKGLVPPASRNALGRVRYTIALTIPFLRSKVLTLGREPASAEESKELWRGVLRNIRV